MDSSHDLKDAARASISSSMSSATLDPNEFDPIAWRHSGEDMEKRLPDLQDRKRRSIWRWTKHLVVALFLCSVLYVLSFFGHDETAQFRAFTNAPTKAVIIASIKDQYMGWLDEVPNDWKIYRYIADDPNAALTVPRNQGQEAMAYLTYIIDHYNDLPDYMVFIHGHEKAWHQPPPMQWLLQSMDMDVVERNGWVSLRCSNWGRCEGPEMYTHPREGDWAMSVILRGIHEYTYRPEDPWYEDLPEDIAVACCAQFAVSKRQTLSKPLDFWIRLREPLLSSNLETDLATWDPPDAEGTLSWRIGATFEFSWHWFFGMDPVYCPTETFCTKHLFQNMVTCDAKTLGPPEAFGTWENINCTYGAASGGPVLEVSLPVSPAPPQVDPQQLDEP